MSAASERPRRPGWPWSAAGAGTDESADIDDKAAAVVRGAAAVVALTHELAQAVSRLQEARLELDVATDVPSLEAARLAVERARSGPG